MEKRDAELFEQVEQVRKQDPGLEDKLERYRRDRGTYEKEMGRGCETGLLPQSHPRQRSSRWQQSSYIPKSVGGVRPES
jgi:hypothetical protein